MSALRAEIPHLWTPAEYLAAEEAATFRHEYFNGVVYNMAGAGSEHNLIVANIARAIGNHFEAPAGKPRRCRVYGSEMRLRIESAFFDCFYYPDVIVACGGPRNVPQLADATIVVEVLSESTRGTDLREKLLAYSTLPGLQTYLAVETDRPAVRVFRRSERGMREFVVEGLEGSVDFPEIEFELPFAAIYGDVEFPSPGLR